MTLAHAGQVKNTKSAVGNKMIIKQIHHIAISVRNLKRTKMFYQDIFGFNEIQRFERKDLNGKAIFMKLGGIQIEIWKFKDCVEPGDDITNFKIIGLRHIAFSVNNLDKIYKNLKPRIEITKPILGASGQMYCFCKDPDGILIELYEKN